MSSCPLLLWQHNPLAGLGAVQLGSMMKGIVRPGGALLYRGDIPLSVGSSLKWALLIPGCRAVCPAALGEATHLAVASVSGSLVPGGAWLLFAGPWQAWLG